MCGVGSISFVRPGVAFRAFTCEAIEWSCAVEIDGGSYCANKWRCKAIALRTDRSAHGYHRLCFVRVYNVRVVIAGCFYPKGKWQSKAALFVSSSIRRTSDQHTRTVIVLLSIPTTPQIVGAFICFKTLLPRMLHQHLAQIH